MTSLVLWQIRYEQRAFWRDRRRAILSFMFPLMMLLLFGSLNQHSTVDNGDGTIPFLTFFVPGIIAYGVVTTTFSNLAISLASAREQGLLKRIKGTPLPWWAFFGGRAGSAICVTADDDGQHARAREPAVRRPGAGARAAGDRGDRRAGRNRVHRAGDRRRALAAERRHGRARCRRRSCFRWRSSPASGSPCTTRRAGWITSAGCSRCVRSLTRCRRRSTRQRRAPASSRATCCRWRCGRSPEAGS